jgi:hypothetical protein
MIAGDLRFVVMFCIVSPCVSKRGLSAEIAYLTGLISTRVGCTP